MLNPDTIYLKLAQNQVRGTDFLSETPCYLENVKEHSNGSLTGYLNNPTTRRGFKVNIFGNCVIMYISSLPKFCNGNPYKMMSLQDIEEIIKVISDELHLPVGRASVLRLDTFINVFMDYSPEMYYNHLGEMPRYKRLVEPDGLYYVQKNKRWCIYDKNKEQQTHNAYIPDGYGFYNVLRVEQRYLKRVPSQLKIPELTAYMLYEREFWNKLTPKWLQEYNSIQEINNTTIGFKEMNTIKAYKQYCVLEDIKRRGGLIKVLEQVKEAYKRGELTKKQAQDFKKMFTNVNDIRTGLTVPNEARKELDRKVREVVQFS